MNVIPVAALTIGALLLTLGLRSSSRQTRDKRRDGGGGDSGGWSDGGDCDGGDGGGCD